MQLKTEMNERAQVHLHFIIHHRFLIRVAFRPGNNLKPTGHVSFRQQSYSTVEFGWHFTNYSRQDEE